MVKMARGENMDISDFGFRISDFDQGGVIRGSIYVILLSLCLINQSAAQEVKVTARVDSNNILIGDWLTLHVEVRHPGHQDIQFVALPDSLAGFEIIQRDSIQRQSIGEDIVESTSFTITAYDTGTFIIPPLNVRYKSSVDTATLFAESSPIPVFVHGMAVDTTKEIKDIKPPMTPGISFSEILPYLIGIVVIAAVVWVVFYVMKKRKRGESIIPEPPPRPAHEVALEALRSLDAEKLWQRGKVKEYHSKLTDIVRLYIERRFDVRALEMITDEILSAQEIKRIDHELYNDLRELLTLADLVKFARVQPAATEHEKCMRSSTAFVEGTRRRSAGALHPEVLEEVGA